MFFSFPGEVFLALFAGTVYLKPVSLVLYLPHVDCTGERNCQENQQEGSGARVVRISHGPSSPYLVSLRDGVPTWRE